ncbi:hypothetical protein POM88_014274 [Heracleum sosnowskyi]|uniref:DDE Tnp4 domain-containing protein n=1 Tax=Heracleum sosnowskyi TaxID=360622 RepID=A0AAD8J259_9APIA|nr:hypothetical protein POM88_014274 [Heracleum sosnowskyi]
MARLPLCKKKQTIVACVTIYTKTVKRITDILIEIFQTVAQLCVKIPTPMNYLFDDSVDDRVRARFLNIKSIIQISDQKPEPVIGDCSDEKWSCFKNCLGALDGTYVNVRVSEKDKVRYKNRKEHRVGENGGGHNADFVQHLESSTVWTNFRQQLANEMFNDWQNSRHL